MSDTANNSVAGARRAPSSAPLQVHAWSVEYIRLKAFAFAIRTVIGGLGPIAEFFFQQVPKEVEVVKTTIPSRQPGRSIKIHIYTPKDAAKGKKLPVHLNLHGSGFVIPSLGSDREFCGEMSKRLECVVIDCDYRKAPEHPAPAQMQDAEDCILWALSQESKYDTSRVSVGGFSAGANLALCVAGLHGDHLTACISFYPPTDFQVSRYRKEAPEKHSAALPPSVSKFFDRCYLVAGTDRADPTVSPVEQDTSKFPPHVWLTCATGDTLYHDGEKFIDKLVKEGHPDARFHKITGEGHAFDKIAKSGTPTFEKKTEVYNAAMQMVQDSWKDTNQRQGAKL